MKKIKNEFEVLSRLAKGIAAQFGEKCEVVLHDYEQPFDHTIVAIENGHITGRKVGDSSTNLGLEVMKGSTGGDDKYSYITQTKDGKILKSSTVYLRDQAGAAIGSLCINFDITDLKMAESTIRTITSNNASQETKEVITNDINELLDALIWQSIDYVGVPVAHMAREDKIKGLIFLEGKGAFLIKKSSEKVSKVYDISKYTLYNYLNETKNSQNEAI
ncbi:Transcriptional regulator DauR [bioreactor metagenome]|uniref:Transcriptional regulator DauR n=1 Tax=bioreactor metagenome TaxID=1076179 RepID=A0A644X0N6_9ZZZZ